MADLVKMVRPSVQSVPSRLTLSAVRQDHGVQISSEFISDRVNMHVQHISFPNNLRCYIIIRNKPMKPTF